MRLSDTRRAGLTLVELIVVIAIVATLATLTALYFPRFQEQSAVDRAADMIQGWLLIAKQQARRDGVPTGLQLTFTGGVCSEMTYIQQPEDFAVGQFIGQDGTNPAIGVFQFPTGIDFTTEGTKVQAGDYIELFGTGLIRRISTVTAVNKLQIDTARSPGFPAMTVTPPVTSPTNYRIIPAPRAVAGEQALRLPDEVGVRDWVSSTEGSQNLAANKQILFAPSGAVIGEGSASGQIMLWIKHLRTGIDKKTLITVQPRTGLIAAHPVSSTAGDPFEFTRDARSSGL